MSLSHGFLHQSLSTSLYYNLSKYVDKKDLGVVYSSLFEPLFQSDSNLQPDILFFSQGNIPESLTNRDNLQPDLIITILFQFDSSEMKRLLNYFNPKGLMEYWFIDIENKFGKIYLANEKEVKLYQEGHILHSVVIDEFEVSLLELID